jgi:hypothetical protein
MRNSLERTVATADQRLVVVAPGQGPIPDFFENVPSDDAMRDELVSAIQRLRGAVYLRDGAISNDDLTSDGRHVTREDERAWHLLVLDGHEIAACVWYLQHDNVESIEDLRVRNCPLAGDDGWRQTLRKAVERELTRARCARLHYAELGGWAVAPSRRNTGEGLILALAAYSLGRAFGGALGLTTATVRHASSTILRRLGGASLEADGVAVPPYYDPRYRCEMELLRFDSRSPNPRYDRAIDVLRRQLARVPVVCCGVQDARPLQANAAALVWQPAAATGGAAA